MRIGCLVGRMFAAALVFGTVAAARVEAAPAYVWVEGETPASANFQYEVQAWGPVFSAGKWLAFSRSKEDAPAAIPAGGLLVSYGLEVPQAGAYEVWARVGFEWIRAPLEWRVNDGPWARFAADVTTTNVIEAAVWAEVAWGKLGAAALPRGKSTLDIRYTEPGPDGRLVIGLDCLALVEGAGNFTPDGVLRPGEDYDTAVDLRAREQVFRFPTALPESPAERIEVPLNGFWEVARYDDPDMDKDTYQPVQALPAAGEYGLHWRGIEVPGDARRRPEMVFGHRLLYRTRVDVPAVLKGRAFRLHFSGTCWIASVFVNGRFIGGHQSVLVPWDMDITQAVRSGEVNTIIVGIKSSWYGLDPDEGKSVTRLRNIPYEGDFKNHVRYVAPICPSSKGEGDGTEVGIVNPVVLVATGPAYVAGIFVRTSVAGKRLDADVTVRNSGGAAAELAVLCEAVNTKTGEVEKAFGPVGVSVPGAEGKVVTIGDTWEGPDLWWPEDDPDLYVMRTTVSAGRVRVDVHEQLFGFREVSIAGKDFLLNGIPWHFWNWVSVGRAGSEQEWLANYHAQNDRFHRMGADDDRWLGDREKALDFYDRHGVPGRLSTCIDGMFITHRLENPLVWENFRRHVEQVVVAYRNHPSIMMYSLENELMFITSRLAYDAATNERWAERTYELCEAAKRLDPTRASFGDGAGDLNRRGEINCQHYSWASGGSVPAALYSYPIREAAWQPSDTWDRSTDQYDWDGRRPLVLGEVFYYAGNVSGMAWVGGPDVYRGKEYADRAAARYARMAIEGARWQGVTGICPWVVAREAAVSFEPRAAFVREYNSAFYAGATLTRTVKVFNDGRREDPLTLKWRLVLDGREAAAGGKTYDVPPGRDQEDVISAALPAVADRADGQLELELYAQGERVFRDAKPVSVLPAAGAVEGLGADSLAVHDPGGSVRKWLEGRGQAYAPLESLTQVPATATVLLIGPNALAENEAAEAEAIKAFVQAGKTAIVLEQKHPLEGDDLPVAGIAIAGEGRDRAPRPEFRAAGGQSGRIAFPVAPAHPVLKSVQASDFFTWAPDETEFRLSYASPTTGAIALVQAGNQLGLAPLMDVRVGQGSYLLCQMLVGEKLGVEPTADLLLRNMLAWASQKAQAKPGVTVAYLAGDEGLRAFLDGATLAYETADSVDAALAGRPDVAVLRATPAVLGELQQRKDEVQAFCADGRWLMLVGLDADGLKAFDDLVGFEHRIRPFRREAVTLQARADALLLGLSDRDVNMVSDEILAPWANLYWVSSRTFTAVVDGAEIASFAQFAGEDLTTIADGLTNADFWRYTHYFSGDGASVDLKFDRPETFTNMNIWSNDSYYLMKDIELVFDGDQATALPFTLEARAGRQEIAFEPRRASVVTIRIKDHHPRTSSQNLVGIDDLELFRELPADFGERVVLLTKPGGLAKYPIGRGGIVLNQIDYAAKDTEQNVRKKLAIYANVLRNMGSSFGQ